MKSIIDISVELSEDTLVYPGDPRPEFEQYRTIEKDSYSLLRLRITTHTSTHMDAPKHVLLNGTDVTGVPLERLIGRARVLKFEKSTHITKADLEKYSPAQDEIILLKTGEINYLKSGIFRKEYIALTKEAAEYLVKCGIKAVGIDGLSIEPYDGDLTVHKILLSAGIPIFEVLDLESVGEGIYSFIGLPLKIRNGDGAPARVILTEE